MSNNTILVDFQLLQHDELIEEYDKLAKSYNGLKQNHEADSQKIYELKRCLQTSTNAEAYLAAELESIGAVHKEELAKLNHKNLQAVEEFKFLNADLKQANAALEAASEKMKTQIQDLNEKLTTALSNAGEPSFTKNNESLNNEREMVLEKENAEIMGMLNEYKDKIDALTLQKINFISEIDVMKENIECLKDNLQSKKDDITDLQLALETAHEKSVEVSAELAMYKNAPDNPNKKGNSLFAEVHDQREQLSSVLAVQNKHYKQMKKIHRESEMEIRRLKRENQAICNDVKLCSKLFLEADIVFKDKLEERISKLMEKNENLQKNLSWTETKLKEMAANKNINWVESILAYSKSETQALKNQLYTVQMQKSEMDTKIWQTERDLAKWRFESLKSRFIIINRESLLEEHKIHFKAYDEIERDVKIDEFALSNAKPHIGFNINTKEEESIDIVIENPNQNENENVMENQFRMNNEGISTNLVVDSGLMVQGEANKNDNDGNEHGCAEHKAIIQENINKINNNSNTDSTIDAETSKPDDETKIINENNEASRSAIKSEDKENCNTTVNQSLMYRDIIYTPKLKPLSENIKSSVRRGHLFDAPENSDREKERQLHSKSKITIKRIVIPSKCSKNQHDKK